ncbi:ATP-binding protein [Alkalibacillus haloalkaliphilus]|uniref:ATP-binding protein n=1 Tax=Alkalibacillus haloalkaliphilus TaxID=94136 RepID=UPI00178C302A|nr:ATP-binding protein [Alkalibacillus haloalkaliphilus]
MYNKSKEQASRLRNVSEEKDEFLARTSHELRNPLHGILNLTQTTLDRNKGVIDQKSQKELETVLMVGDRLSFLLDDLFNMANLKITKPTIRQKPFYLQSIAAGVLDMFYYVTDENKVTFNNEIQSDLPPVNADENRVIQILYNLIHNAVKFTKEGEISLSARADQQKVIVTVKDTGDGMNTEAFDEMFQPYEQGENNINNSESGVGLGLSVSKELVELHGEDIYGSSRPGVGTEISFTLSVSHEKPYELSREQTLTVNSNPLNTSSEHLKQNNQSSYKDANILIIDDDFINLNVIESVLSEENYELTSVQHSRDLLKELNMKEWDLLILDVMMPDLSGYDLTNKVREQFNKTEIPILLLTARSNPKDVVTGFNVGANDYISKPVNAKELRARVRSLVNIKKSTEKQLKLESKWLQAQIQPHFIFNTLNTISALSNTDIEKMKTLIEEFSELLRFKFNFSAYNELVSVEEELSIVRSYVYIEQVRFGDKINVSWNIDSAKEFSIPLLTVQTIVENAVKHGVMKQADGGKIEIKVFKRKDYLRIVVKDNGVGMDQETIQSIYNSDDIKGVGLVNTNKRLKMYSKTELEVRSIVGVGTIVAINIYNKSDRGGRDY